LLFVNLSKCKFLPVPGAGCLAGMGLARDADADAAIAERGLHQTLGSAVTRAPL